MTYEEAITTLRKALACSEDVGRDCLGRKSCEECEHYYSVRKCKESLAIAIEELEKRIPKKPKKLTYKPLTDSGWEYGCPCCGLAIGENSFTDYEYIEPIEPYCGQCGQAIDWSDEE